MELLIQGGNDAPDTGFRPPPASIAQISRI
jgi:hypothetical protein